MSRWLISAIMTVLVFWAVGPAAVHAAAVSPSSLEISVSRGETISASIQVINPDPQDQVYYFQAMKFTARDDSGAPQFIPYDQDHSGVPEWIRFSSRSLTIPARSKAEVPFSLSIPPDAASGGFYGAVLVSDAPSEVVAANGASVQASVAVLLFVTIEGETVREAALLDFQSPQQGRVTSTLQGPFTYRIQNQGNVHVLPSGFVTVKDFFGRVVTAANANPDGGRVLPGTTRTFQGMFGEGESRGWVERVAQQGRSFALGPMTATLAVDYGGGAALTGQFRFWFIPWQSLLVFTAMILVAVIVPRLMRRRSL